MALGGRCWLAEDKLRLTAIRLMDTTKAWPIGQLLSSLSVQGHDRFYNLLATVNWGFWSTYRDGHI